MKLLLNTGPLLHTKDGSPVPTGGVTLADEFEDDPVDALVSIEKSELGEDLDAIQLSARAARALGRNADAAGGDDADVKTTTSRGGPK